MRSLLSNLRRTGRSRNGLRIAKDPRQGIDAILLVFKDVLEEDFQGPVAARQREGLVVALYRLRFELQGVIQHFVQVVALLDGVSFNRRQATQGDDLLADQFGMAKRLLGAVKEHARIDFPPQPSDDKPGLSILGDAGPLVTEALVQLFDQLR